MSSDERSDPAMSEELRQLHDELSELDLSERQSFDPELRAELEAEWLRLEAARAHRERERRLVPLLAGPGRAIAAGLALALCGAWALSAGVLPGFPGVGPEREPVAAAPESVEMEAPLTVVQVDVPPPAVEPIALPILDDAVDPSAGSVPAQGVYLSLSAGPSAEVTEAPAATQFAYTEPQLVDYGDARLLFDEFYPDSLRDAGVGGAVTLSLYIDEDGAVMEVEPRSSLGAEALAEAAAQAASALRFRPALAGDHPIGVWVELPIRYGLDRALEVVDVPARTAPFSFDPLVGTSWDEVAMARAEDHAESPDRGSVLGPVTAAPDRTVRFRRTAPAAGVEAARTRTPPETTVSATLGREALAASLEDRIDLEPEEPVPYLALGRIRKAQGLREEARRLFDEGASRARAAGDPSLGYVLANLEYERGLLLREDFHRFDKAGDLPAVAFEPERCSAPVELIDGRRGVVPSGSLIVWNYLCPNDFKRAVEDWFDPFTPSAELRRTWMLQAFKRAVLADPRDIGAATELLLGIADGGRWDRTLTGARALIELGEPHPHLLLIEAMALQGVGQTSEAGARFDRALSALEENERRFLTNPSVLLEPWYVSDLEALDEEGRSEWIDGFWERVESEAGVAPGAYRTEFTARAAYVLLRMGALTNDAGELWVRYGRPLTVRTVSGAGQDAIEFWDYGPGPDITLRRLDGLTPPVLTPEGRAYLQELELLSPYSFSPEGEGVPTEVW